MSSNLYFPLLKSSVSELRALKLMKRSDLNDVIPIFELTKSRKSKNNPGGDVYKKIDEIIEIIGDSEFVLDLTNEDSLSNEQIESFFEDSNAFYNWTDFIERIVKEKDINVTPMLLAYDDTGRDILLTQAERLLRFCERISVRIPVELVGEAIVDELLHVVDEIENIIVFIDLGYVREEHLSQKIENSTKLLQALLQTDDSIDIVMLASSFPASVVEVVPNSEKMSSKFKVYGRQIYDYLLKIDPELQYGDYACIHPFRGEPRPMMWIPRVDYPYDNHVIFERCRREDGGYEKCASAIAKTSHFENNPIDCWGYREIQAAARGEVNGKNPSYWISVRSNIHMSRMVRK